MSKELKLVSPICPTVNHYMNYRVIRQGKRNVVLPYPSTETKEYKKKFIPYVQNEVKQQGWEMDYTGLQHYYVDWVVYFDRIDRDAANLDKVLIDSITEAKCVWVDDNVVCNRVKHIYYDAMNPRIELTIHAVDYIGIFDNQEQLDMFENKCKTCSRYSRNCSILKNAKTGRIQEEINDLVCGAYKEKKAKKAKEEK